MPPHRQISQRIRLPLLFLFLLIPILAACHTGDTYDPDDDDPDNELTDDIDNGNPYHPAP